MTKLIPLRFQSLCAALALCLLGTAAQADAITDWNLHATELLVTTPGMGPPPAYRLMALAHTAMFDAVESMASDGAAADAAVAAAGRAVFVALLPAQKARADAWYDESLARVPDAAARTRGAAAGERAAAAVLARRAGDKVAGVDAYVPHTTPGVYVPTLLPAAAHWPGRTPWLMTSTSQFRPAPPPALNSATWARDYEEIREFGRRQNSRRTPEQTDMARFWEATLPGIYHGLARNLAEQPGRDLRRNARLFAAVSQAMDDSLIAVFDAKYHYAFWRPVTAIRNGDRDGNDATQVEPGWLPLVDTPMHPEYPCAHCIQAATLAEVLKADLGKGTAPGWQTSSYLVKDSLRRFVDLDAFPREVAEARILGGVHYRNSTQVGLAMGRQVGQLAAQAFYPPR